MKPTRTVLQIVALASSIALAGGYVAFRASRAPAADAADPDALDVGVTAEAAITDSPHEMMSSSKSMVVEFDRGTAGERQTQIEFVPTSQPTAAQGARKPPAPRPREVMSGSKFAAIIDPIPPAPATQPTSQPANAPPPNPPPTSSAPSQPQSATPEAQQGK